MIGILFCAIRKIHTSSKFDYTSLWWKQARNAAVFQIGYHVCNNSVYKDINEYMRDESYFMPTSIQIVLFKALQLHYNLVFARFTCLVPATRISKFSSVHNFVLDITKLENRVNLCGIKAIFYMLESICICGKMYSLFSVGNASFIQLL